MNYLLYYQIEVPHKLAANYLLILSFPSISFPLQCNSLLYSNCICLGLWKELGKSILSKPYIVCLYSFISNK